MSAGNEPAWPVECYWNKDGSFNGGIQTGNVSGWATGLTKREHAAIEIAKALLTGDAGHGAAMTNTAEYREALAAQAVEQADALLAALSPEGAK